MAGITPRQRLFASALVCAMGAFILLLSLGVIPWSPTPSRRQRAIFADPYHWQIGVVGLAFFSAGVAMALDQRRPRLARTASIIAALSLVAAIAGVVVFKLTS